MEESKINRRRIYFIEKGFQARFIMNFCGLVVLGGILTIAILYFLSQQSTTVSVVNSRVVVRTTADFLLPVLIQTVVVVMIIVGLATVAVTLFVSHKIAGPIYHFKKVLQNLSTGDFSAEFSLRRLDQLQDVAGAFNAMISRIRKQLNLLKANFISLKEKLNTLSEHEIVEHKRSSLAELKKMAEELDKIVHYFKS